MKTNPSKTLIICLAILSLLNISAIRFDVTTLQSTEKVIFAVVGDFGQASQPEADVASLVKSWNPDFIVTLGDNNYPHGAASTIDDNIGQYYHDYIFPYHGKFGAGAAYKRFFPILGNHDWETNGAKPYYSYFSIFNEIGYYDFIKGPVHFFMLDSDPHEPDGTSSTSSQAKWLKKGLAVSTSDFNIVLFHHSPYSSGKHGSTTYMQWPFKAWGADAVLSGHDHIYERLLIDGLPYFVNGVGGAELYEYGTIVTGSQIRYNQDFGAMRVEATGSSVKFQFFTRSGLLVDEYTIGKSVPVVTSITRSSPNPSNTSSADFLVTFSEAVSGVDTSDFSLTSSNINGALINSVNGSGSSYTISVNTGTGDGNIQLNLIDNDSISNSYGIKLGSVGVENGNFSNGEVYSIDKSSPTVSSISRLSPNPSNVATVDFQVIFSEPVTGVDAADLSISSSNGASLNSINGSGSIYIIILSTGQANDLLRLDIIDNDSVTDFAGNQLGGTATGNGNYAAGETYTIDRVAPMATSIIRAGVNPSNTTTVDFIVTFSEFVSGVDSTDFSISAANISSAFIINITNSSPFYIVTVNTGAGTGSIRLDLIDNDSILDNIGNPLGTAGVGNGNFINGEIYNIEKSAPLVNSIVRAGVNPSNSAIVDWIVTFSDSVSDVDASDFSLSTDGVSNASISNVNGSGNTYIISINTRAGDGTLRLDLIDNDSILNASGNPLGGLGTGNGNFINADTYTIDKTIPVVTSIIRASTNPSAATSVDFIVTFSEPVAGVDVSDFHLTSSEISNAFISSITNANPFYVVTVNTGTGSGTIRLDLSDDDTIVDSAGNQPGGPGNGNGAFINGETYNIEKNFPRVTSITRASPNPSNAASVDFIVTFSESVSGVDVSDFGISATNLINASILNVTNVDPFYIVTVNTGMGTGDLRLDLIDDDSIANVAGSKPGGPGSGNGTFTNGETFSISKTIVNFPPPSIKEPRKDFLTNNPKFSFTWDKVRGASAYEIMIALDANFTQIVSSQTVSGLSYASSMSFSDNFYYWHVRAYNSGGQPGKFSPTYKFTIDTKPPPAPALRSPANNVTTTKTNFVWEKIDSATKYQVDIDNNSDFSSPEWSSLRNSPAYQTYNLRRGNYYWRIRAKDLAGNWGIWSDPFVFKIP